MMEGLARGDPARRWWRSISRTMMLVQALRLYFSERSDRDVGWFAALADPQLSGAIGEMHADPAHAWALHELAKHAAMSRSTFAQRFRDRVGDTPIAYLTRWRMMLAGERLAHGRDPIARKAPFKLKDIWALRVRFQMKNRIRELALFNLGIDSKLRGCELVALKVRDVCHGDQMASRAVVMQHKTQRPVQFEITSAARDAV